jgi:DNA-binding response OmpR family regulator
MDSPILVIEDNPEMRDNIAAILELSHYKVITASNGKEGVQMAQESHPELILCDVMMPELDGHGVLYILRNNPETASIPFIFLTAKADKSDFREGMSLGADDYITKPFDGADLLKVIKGRLKRVQQLKAILLDQLPDSDRSTAFRDFVKLVETKPGRSIKKGDTLFLEGQTPSDLFFIQQGSFKTFKLNSDGKELITGLFASSDFLGYSQLLEDLPYQETAEALEESKVSVVSKSDFLAAMFHSTEVARKFVSKLSGNIREMENRMLDIAYQSVRQRVAGIILRLASWTDSTVKDIDLTRKNMASLVGTAPESLNRTLSDFKEEGLIEILSTGIRIINRPKLERILR